MMGYRLRNIVIRDTAGRIKYRRFKTGGRDHYHIGVWVEADDDRAVDRIECVEYKLHPTFKNRIRKSSNRSTGFTITFWSWGTFDIEATLHLVGGGTLKVTHPLAYDLPADESHYIDVTPSPS